MTQCVNLKIISTFYSIIKGTDSFFIKHLKYQDFLTEEVFIYNL